MLLSIYLSIYLSIIVIHDLLAFLSVLLEIRGVVVLEYYDPAARLPWLCDMVTESTISLSHQRSSCYVVPKPG